MEPSSEVLFFCTILVAILFYTYYTSRQVSIKRKLRNTGLKNIAEVVDGEEVRISGTVKILGKSLVAPLSLRKCAYYHVFIEQRIQSGKNLRWYTLIDEELAGDIVIYDGLNYAYIDTSFVKTYLFQDRTYNSGFLNNASETLLNYLQKKNLSGENWLGLNKRLRYKEGVLEDGETLEVSGFAKWMKTSDTHLKIRTSRILVLTPNEKTPVHFTDDGL